MSTKWQIIVFLWPLFLFGGNLTHADEPRNVEFWVSPSGNDQSEGTRAKPFATFARARLAARNQRATVWFASGVYYLSETVRFTAEDHDTTYACEPDARVVFSGGLKLELNWKPYRDGIFQASTPAGLTVDQLFIDGQRQLMARYPNFDPKIRPYGGYSADAFDKQRASRWSDPSGGFIHAMHSAHWGGYHYRITGKDAEGKVTYEGGWQNNRQMGMHDQYRYVENVFEELDAPGEWYHDSKASTLYFIPPTGLELTRAIVEVVRLRHLFEFHGSQQSPVRNISLNGFGLRHSARTFMDVKEPLLRSDWTIYRGGAVLFHGSENCSIEDCDFDQLGGNAIFVDQYNRRIAIRGCDLRNTGASAVAFVGDPRAVRNPLFEYGQQQSFAEISQIPGPQTDNYPADCLVEDCLIRGVGIIEKQATGVEISMSIGITIRNCSIYDASRAGINVSEGTFGGHVIEFCDVFDTVRETGDHGSFNSWGRDRFWGLKDAPEKRLPEIALLDVVKPNIIRNSRWRCDHGWDVDLDDGSSNYEIYNNLFLNGGLKLREGFHRTVRNNITVNNSLHPHVWYENSGDVVTGNIWMGAYRPAAMNPGLKKWGHEIDRNLFTTSDTDRLKFADKGCDAQSLVGDPLFVDPAKGDYRVGDGSPALALGFQNFSMDQFGVRPPRLKALARTPELPKLKKSGGQQNEAAGFKRTSHLWQAEVRSISGAGDRSAYGLPAESGVLLVNVSTGSLADKAGLATDDVILAANGVTVKTTAELQRLADRLTGKTLQLDVIRKQAKRSVTVSDYAYLVTEQQAKEQFDSVPLLTNSAVVPLREVTMQPETANEPVAVLNDGRLARNYGPVFRNGVQNGCYKADLGAVTNLSQVNVFSFNENGLRARQSFILFGSRDERDPGWDVNDPKKFTAIFDADVRVGTSGSFLATSIRQSGGNSLGSYRWLIWATTPISTTDGGENTAFQEFQILPVAAK